MAQHYHSERQTLIKVPRHDPDTDYVKPWCCDLRANNTVVHNCCGVSIWHILIGLLCILGFVWLAIAIITPLAGSTGRTEEKMDHLIDLIEDSKVLTLAHTLNTDYDTLIKPIVQALLPLVQDLLFVANVIRDALDTLGVLSPDHPLSVHIRNITVALPPLLYKLGGWVDQQ